MTKRMLIDAAHPEETRVVIVDANRVEELDFESRHKRQLRGNVYLARVTRVEPSLQAAFIEYGGNRHGFLAFSEIHPDYYKIPEADKQALKEQEEEDQRLAEEEEEKRKAASAKRKSRTKRDEEEDEFEDEDEDHHDDESDEDEDDEERDENLDPDHEDAADEDDAEVADEQVKVASKRRKRISHRRYKIQEVIKRGQILLVQAVKEERGNKGAAMTTYLSLAGRYCVLMPNTPRGGGISRKISNGSDRKRLKTIMNDLDVPQGMGVIVRTAGAKRTKAEIQRDYEYLSRLWSDIRETTMESTAPSLIHEEGNLVKRSIRDLYNKEIEEVLVQGEEAFKTAKSFINMLMPSHSKFVKHYEDDLPLYLRYGVEKQIENSLDATVQLKSGGYLVIHPTEALISVDVNSGRSTKERNIERTALKTNLEAAEELARQMRLRDLAGLIVVDFIDMDENKNNRAVERKMKDMLSRDRARIQTSRISQFGLMEISRQRRRRSLLEGSTTSCPHCSGVGRKRTLESSALAAIRAVEEFAVRGKAKRIRLKTSKDVALYLLNEKRDLLTQVDQVTDVFTEVVGEDDFIRPHFELEVVEKRTDKRKDPLVKIEQDFKKEIEEAKRKEKAKPKDNKNKKDKDDDEAQDANTDGHSEDEDENNRKSGRRRSRRGRRGGRGRGRRDENRNSESEESETQDALEVINPEGETSDGDKANGEKPKRRRRRRKSTKSEDAPAQTVADTVEETPKPSRGRRRAAPGKKAKAETSADAEVETPDTPSEEKPKSRSTTRRKAPDRKSKDDATADVTETEAKDEKPKRKRRAPAKAKADIVEEGKPEAEAKPKRTRKASTKKAEVESEAEAKPTRKRRAPAKKTPAKTEEEASTDAKPKRTRKAPAKAKSEPAEDKAEAKPKRTRKAPAKAAKEEAVEEKPKAKRTRKAPAKADDTEAEKPAKASTAAKKAPAKKTATKKAPAKKAAAKKPVETEKPKAAPKRTRKAPAKVEAKVTEEKVTAEKVVEEKPKRTRKAPAKAETAPIEASKKPEVTPAPVQEDAKAAKKKKKKLGWWSRKK